MNIFVINGATDLYGANRIMSLALKALATGNNKIQLLLPELQGPLVRYICKNNPEVLISQCDHLPIIQRSMFSVRGGGQLVQRLSNFYFFLRQQNKKEKIDLIYVNTLSNFFVIPVARSLGINTLTHVHEILESPKIVSSFINRFSVKWSTYILAVSHAVKANLLKASSGSGKDNITVVHNGIPDVYQPEETSLEKSAKCIITLIGRIKPDKGIWYLLEALKLMKNKENLLVRIIGGPAPSGEKHVEQLKKDIPTIGVEIEYLSFIPDVRKYLNETDILVAPSTGTESFPTTVLEGMSAGKAVIATNTGGAVEAIVNETSGFIISNNDPRHFAEILSLLLKDVALRNKVGEEARKRYLSKFSVEVYNKNMETFYATILS